MSKLKLSATPSEDDLRRISEWSAGQRDTAKEQGRREGIEEVAVWLEGKMPKWGAASKGMAAEVRALQSGASGHGQVIDREGVPLRRPFTAHSRSRVDYP